MEELRKVRKAINNHFATYEVLATIYPDMQRTYAFKAVMTVVKNRLALARAFDIPLCLFMNEFRIVAERRMYDEERVMELNIPQFFDELYLLFSALSADWETYISESRAYLP